MASKGRSPNYPRVELNKAIERVGQLYKDFNQGAFTSEDAARTWGYTTVGDAVRELSLHCANMG